MYEKIIVAIDGSPCSLDALRQSSRIKKDITAVCVAPHPKGDFQSLLRAACDQALASAEEIAEQENALIKTTCELGKLPHEVIVAAAEAKGCDLIVMGRSGRNILERALLGSVTARVIGYSPIDVLVVPEGSTIEWNRILLATDGSDFSKNATQRALALAREYGGELKVVTALDVPSEIYSEAPGFNEKLREEAKDILSEVMERGLRMGLKTDCIIREGRSYKVILNVAGEQGTGVIVVGSYGRTGLQRLLMGSVTERVISHASCPVLVVKHHP
jgi:nucleotide-binding universal stress UspA family protein